MFGFPIGVEFWFWITCILLGGGLRAQGMADAIGLAIWTIVVFFSILIHELGHATVGRRYGAHPEIRLHAFGGVAMMHGQQFTRAQDLQVTAAGPAASLALGGLALLIHQYGPELPREIRETVIDLLWINFFWTFLNLLPILPLDGGNLLRGILGPSRLQLTAWIGFGCALVVAALAFMTDRWFLAVMMALLAFENLRLRNA